LDVSLFAKAGDYDSSFEDDGKVTSYFFGTDDYQRDAAMFSDGSMVSIGFVNGGAGYTTLVMYDSRGEFLDIIKTSFAGGIRKCVEAYGSDKIVFADVFNDHIGYAIYNRDGTFL
jgi:ABC-type antimicrobial peptide transport system permease subunit